MSKLTRNPYPTDGTMPICQACGIIQFDSPRLVGFLCCAEVGKSNSTRFICPLCHLYYHVRVINYLERGAYFCAHCGTEHKFTKNEYYELLHELNFATKTFYTRWGLEEAPRLKRNDVPKKELTEVISDYAVKGIIDKKEVYLGLRYACEEIEKMLELHNWKNQRLSIGSKMGTLLYYSAYFSMV